MKQILKLIKAMVAKFHNKSPHGVTKNTGSARIACEYIDKEDALRLKMGLEPYKYVKPDGEMLSTEDAIKYLDNNTKGLGPNDYKFYMGEICPSKAEIHRMGSNEREIYESALRYMKLVIDAYAENYHRDGLDDGSKICIVWKPHWTRGKNGEDQFHIHFVVSRRTQGVPGKELKISPVTAHRDTTRGPVKGGFDRKEFITRCEKLFDELFKYNRKVVETFEYCNTVFHGTVEQKAEQAEKLAAESAPQLEEAIKAGIGRRRKKLEIKKDIDEISALLDGENIVVVSSSPKDALNDAMAQANMKNVLMPIFENAKDKKQLALRLVAEGYTFYIVKAKDVPGTEDIRFIKRGKEYLASELMNEAECHSLLNHWHRLGGSKPAYKIREQLVKKPTQKKYGGPKLGR